MISSPTPITAEQLSKFMSISEIKTSMFQVFKGNLLGDNFHIAHTHHFGGLRHVPFGGHDL